VFLDDRGELVTDSLPTLMARQHGTGAAVEVIPFSAGHARALLGPHLHGDLELMFYAQGSGTDRLGTSAFDVRAGDLLLVTPGIVHDASGLGSARGWAVEFVADTATLGSPARAHGGSTARLWWANPLLAPFVAAGQAPAYARFRVPAEDQSRWAARLRDMEREQTTQAEGWREVLRALLQVTLVELARLAAPYTAGLRQQGDVLLAEVFDVIDARHHEPLSTSDVAVTVGLTPGHLTTLVRRRTGRTVLDWILERRMAAARELLLTTDLSAEKIAGRVGFGDAAYFNRRFRRYHGLSPGRWRTTALTAALAPR
jgi:AraC family transcriptional regulator, transcriptional activator of pobA